MSDVYDMDTLTDSYIYGHWLMTVARWMQTDGITVILQTGQSLKLQSNILSFAINFCCKNHKYSKDINITNNIQMLRCITSYQFSLQALPSYLVHLGCPDLILMTLCTPVSPAAACPICGIVHLSPNTATLTWVAVDVTNP